MSTIEVRKAEGNMEVCLDHTTVVIKNIHMHRWLERYVAWMSGDAGMSDDMIDNELSQTEALWTKLPVAIQMMLSAHIERESDGNTGWMMFLDAVLHSVYYLYYNKEHAS